MPLESHCTKLTDFAAFDHAGAGVAFYTAPSFATHFYANVGYYTASNGVAGSGQLMKCADCGLSEGSGWEALFLPTDTPPPAAPPPPPGPPPEYSLSVVDVGGDGVLSYARSSAGQDVADAVAPVASTLATQDAKFGGAASVAASGVVIFAPHAARSVGVFDAATETLSLVNVSHLVTTGAADGQGSFFGATATADGGRVVFAPHSASVVAVFDVARWASDQSARGAWTIVHRRGRSCESGGYASGGAGWGTVQFNGSRSDVFTWYFEADGAACAASGDYSAVSCATDADDPWGDDGLVWRDGSGQLLQNVLRNQDGRFVATGECSNFKMEHAATFAPSGAGDASRYLTTLDVSATVAIASGDGDDAAYTSDTNGDAAYAGSALAHDGTVIFAPYSADGVGVYNPTTNAFSYHGLPAEHGGGTQKFHGAATAHNGLVVFPPYRQGGVGVYDPQHSEVSIVALTWCDAVTSCSDWTDGAGASPAEGAAVCYSTTLPATGECVTKAGSDAFCTGGSAAECLWSTEYSDAPTKFSGAAAATNGLVVFAPAGAGGVGTFDPVTSVFAYVDVSSTVATANGVGRKFSSAVAVASGLVYFTPFDEPAAGVFDPETRAFTLLDLAALSGASHVDGFCAAAGLCLRDAGGARTAAAAVGRDGRLVLAPYDVDFVATIAVPTVSARGVDFVAVDAHLPSRIAHGATEATVHAPASLTFVDITATVGASGSFTYMFASAAATGDLVVFVPEDADGVGIYDTTTSTFELLDISATLGACCKFFAAATAGNGQVVMAPMGADGVGVYDPASSEFRYLDISAALGSAAGSSHKFFAAATAGNGQVVFSGDRLEGVGIYDAASSTFSYVDISATISIDESDGSTDGRGDGVFGGSYAGVATASNGQVVLAPHDANGVGVYDAALSTFSYFDIAATVSGEDKFSSAVAAPLNRVVFAPNAAGGVGVFDAGTSTFTYVDISATVDAAMQYKFGVAALDADGLVVMAPFAADGVGLYDPSSGAFSYYDVSGANGSYLGASTAGDGRVVMAPAAADGVGVFEAQTRSFTSEDISSTVATISYPSDRNSSDGGSGRRRLSAPRPRLARGSAAELAVFYADDEADDVERVERRQRRWDAYRAPAGADQRRGGRRLSEAAQALFGTPPKYRYAVATDSGDVVFAPYFTSTIVHYGAASATTAVAVFPSFLSGGATAQGVSCTGAAEGTECTGATSQSGGSLRAVDYPTLNGSFALAFTAAGVYDPDDTDTDLDDHTLTSRPGGTWAVDAAYGDVFTFRAWCRAAAAHGSSVARLRLTSTKAPVDSHDDGTDGGANHTDSGKVSCISTVWTEMVVTHTVTQAYSSAGGGGGGSGDGDGDGGARVGVRISAEMAGRTVYFDGFELFHHPAFEAPKFGGAAADESGGLVVFAPASASAGVGLYNLSTSQLSLVDLGSTIATAADDAALFSGAAATGNGKVVFAPYAASGVGVYDTHSGRFGYHDISTTANTGNLVGSGKLQGGRFPSFLSNATENATTVSYLGTKRNGRLEVVASPLPLFGPFALRFTAGGAFDAYDTTDYAADEAPYYCGEGTLNEGLFESLGLVDGAVCCARSCGGSCGGAGCESLPGGSPKCCTTDIQMAAVTCASTGDTACLVPDASAQPPGGLTSVGAASGDVFTLRAFCRSDAAQEGTAAARLVLVAGDPTDDGGAWVTEAVNATCTPDQWTEVAVSVTVPGSSSGPTMAVSVRVGNARAGRAVYWDGFALLRHPSGGIAALAATAASNASKFSGAAAAGGGLVVFAPYDVGGVGVFDTATSAFSYVDVSATVDATTRRFSGAAATRSGRVVLAPCRASGVGVYDVASNGFAYVDVAATIAGSYVNSCASAASHRLSTIHAFA